MSGINYSNRCDVVIALLALFLFDYACHSGNQQSFPVQSESQAIVFSSADADRACKFLDDFINKLNLGIDRTDVNQWLGAIATPLMVAAEFGLHDQARTLLCTYRADPNAIHKALGMNSLTIASAKGHAKIVSLLLDPTNDRMPGFVEAAKRGHISVLELFVPPNSNCPYIAINEKSGNDTALTAAARSGKTEAVQFLLDRGASVNGTTLNGFTPLGCALLDEHQETAQVLVDRGGAIPEISWEEKRASKVEGVWKDITFEYDKSGLVAYLITCYRQIHKEDFVIVTHG